MDAAYFSEHDTIHYSDGGTPNISKSFSRDSLTIIMLHAYDFATS